MRCRCFLTPFCAWHLQDSKYVFLFSTWDQNQGLKRWLSSARQQRGGLLGRDFAEILHFLHPVLPPAIRRSGLRQSLLAPSWGGRVEEKKFQGMGRRSSVFLWIVWDTACERGKQILFSLLETLSWPAQNPGIVLLSDAGGAGADGVLQRSAFLRNKVEDYRSWLLYGTGKD